MSALNPLGQPVRRPSSSGLPVTSSGGGNGSGGGGGTGSGAAVNDIARGDQIVHRFYLKTLAILVEGRLTHYATGGNVAPGQPPKEPKVDKWFNLPIPEIDLYKPDLQYYKSVSAAPPPNVPPLLIAFTLDTSDLLPSQALMWTVDGDGDQKVRLQMDRSKNGIILERWSFVARQSDPFQQLPTASATYKAGIIHFRALYSLVRLMPAYRLYRRLRRANNGLRVGIKLWAPEGIANLDDAWEVMERGLVGINVPLSELAVSEGPLSQRSFDTVPKSHSFPDLTLLPGRFHLSTKYRAEADFAVQDMETVLSSKFVRERELDMDEEWFTPTVARQRMGSSAKPSPIPQSAIGPASGSGSGSQAGSLSDRASQFLSSSPATIAARLAAGQRQGSLGTRGGTVPSRPSSGSAGGMSNWGLLAEGLPFANPAQPSSVIGMGESRPSPPDAQRSRTSSLLSRDPAQSGMSGASVTARRLSAHSIHPFKSGHTLSSSPSASIMRSTPPPGATSASRPITGAGSKPSSLGRTSSYLSQSGRSFTQVQVARESSSEAGGSLLPPTSPLSPSSASFTRQPSFAYRQASSSTSPFIASSLERHDNIGTPPSPSSTAPPQMIKRYSSSFGHRQGRLAGSAGSGNSALPGLKMGSSAGSSGEGANLPGSGSGAVVTRRLSGRISTEGNLSRRSLDSGGSSYTRGVVAATTNDDDDISAFLKTLDTLPRPPSLAQPTHTSRPHLPATSSSLSGPPTPPIQTPESSSGAFVMGRQPITRSHVDATLQRLAESYTHAARTPGEDSQPSSYGLLSASRPSSSSRRTPISSLASAQGSPRPSQTPPPATSPLGSPRRASPLSSPLRRPQTAVDRRRSDDVIQLRIAKSVPSSAAQPGRSLATNETGSPRRGPVLLRGGFTQAAECKPVHQGQRDPSCEPRPLVAARRGSSEGNAERELGSWGKSGPFFVPPTSESRLLGQRTAPSSLGREGDRGGWQTADKRLEWESRQEESRETDEVHEVDESVEGIVGRLEMTDLGRRS